MHRLAFAPRLRWMSAILLCLLLGISHAQAAPVAPPAPAAAPPNQLFVPIAAAPGAGPSSDGLIDAAEQRGEISAETALIYHVFAEFTDPRLPAQYHSSASAPVGRELAGELSARFGRLSPQAQATLQPFLMPPYHAGSWWDLRQQQGRAAPNGIGVAQLRCGQNGSANDPLFNQWHYVDSAGGMVRVWWQARYSQDEAKARNYAAIADSTWLKLTALMHRQPISDNGDETPCRGGDNRLDISLADIVGANGETYSYNLLGGSLGPTYILLRRDAKIGTLIHELMHSFQHAYDVAGSTSEYSWWSEATATWAIHYAEPALNHEHDYAPLMQRVPEAPLETYSQDEKDAFDGHQYGAYLLPLFNQLRTGQPDLVRTSWERFEHDTNSLSAINGVLAGGFRKQWAEFTLLNTNRPPVDTYKKADGLSALAAAKLYQSVALGGKGSADYPLDGNVPHLAAHSFYFLFGDASVRSVLFENPYVLGDYPTAQVRAIYRTESGAWQTADWTAKQWVSLCRDMRSERITELRIVISNSEWQDRSHVLKPATAPTLHATNVACRGWQAEAEFTSVDKGPTWEKTSNIKTTAVYQRYMPPNGPFQVEFYKLASGTATWTYTGFVGDCTGTGNGSYDVRNPDVEYSMITEPYNVQYLPPFGTGSRNYLANGTRAIAQPDPTIVFHCPNSTFEEFPYTSNWLQTDRDGIMQHTLNSDGKSLQGTLSWTEHMQVGTHTVTWTWKMTALPPE